MYNAKTHSQMLSRCYRNALYGTACWSHEKGTGHLITAKWQVSDLTGFVQTNPFKTSKFTRCSQTVSPNLSRQSTEDTLPGGMTLQAQSYCQRITAFNWQWKIMQPETNRTLTLKAEWETVVVVLIWIFSLYHVLRLRTGKTSYLFSLTKWRHISCSDQCRPFGNGRFHSMLPLSCTMVPLSLCDWPKLRLVFRKRLICGSFFPSLFS